MVPNLGSQWSPASRGKRRMDGVVWVVAGRARVEEVAARARKMCVNCMADYCVFV